MLAHSPPLPLIIDRLDEDHRVTAEDEEGIILALQHRDRVRRIRLEMPASNLQRLITAIDDEFPMLEYLYIASNHPHDTGLILPNTFQAPQLCHLVIANPVLNHRISITDDCRGPCHTRTSRDPPICLLPPK